MIPEHVLETKLTDDFVLRNLGGNRIAVAIDHLAPDEVKGLTERVHVSVRRISISTKALILFTLKAFANSSLRQYRE